MDKISGKTFIIVWSIGLIISVIFLGRSIFESAPQLNNTNNQANTGEQTITGQDQIPANILPNTSGENKQVNVLIPEIFTHTGRADIIQSTKNIYDTTVNIYTISGYNTYKNIIDQQLSWLQIDVIMIPSDLLLSYIPYASKLPSNENLWPYVHPMFKNIIDQPGYSYIPYAIDPILTLVSAQINNNTLSLQDIFTYIALRKESKKFAMPLIFGLDQTDKALLQENKENFAGQFMYLYIWLQKIVQEVNITELRTFIDIINSKLPYVWNSANIEEITTRLANRNPACKRFKDICLMAYGFGDIKFARYSEQYTWDKYFSGASTQRSDTRQLPFTNGNSYPTKARWFIVNTKTNNAVGALQFMEQYIKTAIQTGNIRYNSISPFNNSIVNTTPERLTNTQNRRTIIVAGKDTQKEFLEKTPTLPLLKNEYNADLYFQNINRNF